MAKTAAASWWPRPARTPRSRFLRPVPTDNNRRTKANNVALGYNSNGNLISDGSRTYICDDRDRLIQIKSGSTVIASFSYDALGRRIAKTEGGATTNHLYDGLDVVQETQGTTVNPILAGAGIDQRHARSGRAYFLSDLLGSTRLLTDFSGTVIQRYDRDSYGVTTQMAFALTGHAYQTTRVLKCVASHMMSATSRTSANASSWSGKLSNPEVACAQRNIAAVSCISTMLSTAGRYQAWAPDPNTISKHEKMKSYVSNRKLGQIAVICACVANFCACGRLYDANFQLRSGCRAPHFLPPGEELRSDIHMSTYITDNGAFADFEWLSVGGNKTGLVTAKSLTQDAIKIASESGGGAPGIFQLLRANGIIDVVRYDYSGGTVKFCPVDDLKLIAEVRKRTESGLQQ